MKKERFNVSEVAEILINEIDDFKSSAKEIKGITEKLKSTTIQIDPDSMSRLENLIKKQNEREEEADRQRRRFLEVLSKFNEKQTSRLPNWLTGLLIASFMTVIASLFFCWLHTKG